MVDASLHVRPRETIGKLTIDTDIDPIRRYQNGDMGSGLFF